MGDEHLRSVEKSAFKRGQSWSLEGISRAASAIYNDYRSMNVVTGLTDDRKKDRDRPWRGHIPGRVEHMKTGRKSRREGWSSRIRLYRDPSDVELLAAVEDVSQLRENRDNELAAFIRCGGGPRARLYLSRDLVETN